MTFRRESIPVDESRIGGKVEYPGFGIAWLKSKKVNGNWRLAGCQRVRYWNGEVFTCGLGVTLPISTQPNPRLNRPIEVMC